MSLISSISEEPFGLNIKAGCLSLAQGVLVNLCHGPEWDLSYWMLFLFSLIIQVNIWIWMRLVKSTNLKWVCASFWSGYCYPAVKWPPEYCRAAAVEWDINLQENSDYFKHCTKPMNHNILKFAWKTSQVKQRYTELHQCVASVHFACWELDS